MSDGQAHLLIVGRVSHGDFLEGGNVRLAYMNGAFERLGVPITYLRRDSLSSAVGFALTVPTLARLFTGRRRRFFLVSNGLPPARRFLELVSRAGVVPLFFDVHDDPRLQYRYLQIRPLPGQDIEEAGRRLDLSLAKFRYIGFTTPDFSDAFAVEDERKVFVPNASDPSHFPVTPVPREPVVALVGGASPARGADLLIEACARARERVPELRLRLALNNISGGGNLDELKAGFAEPWISFETVDYGGLPAFLAAARVCAIPHKRNRYLDWALPIKLFDYMAAGRPVVATACREMKLLIERERVGLVCDFTPESMADSLVRCLTDDALASQLGSRGRAQVERVHNWHRTQDVVVDALTAELAATPASARPETRRDRSG